MTSRLMCLALTLLVGLSCSSASAQTRCIHKFMETVVRDFKRNNCWPEPFLAADRVAVRSVFNVMVKSGWQRQNILGDHHFQGSDGSLTEAGRIKLHWILNEAPKHHRTVYVHRGRSQQDTTARINTVQQLAQQFVPEGVTPTVVETSVAPAGWPAEQVDAIDRQFLATTPEPRLPGGDSSEGSN